MDRSYDVTIIGAGIIGMATAMNVIKTHPDLRVAVVEKEGEVASHQTGHNSGVIHSGIYYRPGSLKAQMCISGARQLIRFCQEHGVPFDLCGKVVIATQPDQVPNLHELYRRGNANGVGGLRVIEPAEVKSLEPHATCLLGLHVPTTGIVNFSQLAGAYASVFQTGGGDLFLNHKVEAICRSAGGIHVETSRRELSTRLLINCGGLYSDHVARMAGADPPCQIVPFRGEYYQIKPGRNHLVKNLIYPVPDPRFPFLGVHFTRMIDGKVEAGPNAVLAWAREGYNKTRVSVFESMEMIKYEGFRHLVRRYWRQGLQEMVRSCSKGRFTEALKQLIPEIRTEDLMPGGAGVRAQALGKNGALLDDFVILKEKGMIHVLNAPSPAATSSLAIAEHILRIASPLL